MTATLFIAGWHAVPANADGVSGLSGSGESSYKNMDCMKLGKEWRRKRERARDQEDEVDHYQDQERYYQKDYKKLNSQRADLKKAI